MEPSLFFKVVLLFGFVPFAYLSLRVARRYLPAQHAVRLWIERVGIEKLARYAFLAVWAVGGIWLTIAFS